MGRAGRSRREERPPRPLTTVLASVEYDTADTGHTGEHQQEGDPEPEEETPVHEPQACSVDTMVWMSGTPAHCPADHAAFMMDDGHGPNFWDLSRP